MNKQEYYETPKQRNLKTGQRYKQGSFQILVLSVTAKPASYVISKQPLRNTPRAFVFEGAEGMYGEQSSVPKATRENP
jgi:hypothetical protein